MQLDAHTEASDAAKPVCRLSTNTPLPLAELRNDELELLVGSRALFAKGQPPDVQTQVDERIRQAWDELQRRGANEASVVHWNFGRSDARRKEQDAAVHKRYLDYVARFERWSKLKGWARYIAHQPLAALTSTVKGGELPAEWHRQPLSEFDWFLEAGMGMRNLPD